MTKQQNNVNSFKFVSHQNPQDFQPSQLIHVNSLLQPLLPLIHGRMWLCAEAQWVPLRLLTASPSSFTTSIQGQIVSLLLYVSLI